mmetsp:Transcript_14897/g.46859  ORF Transcript_14897/g.46859 Transcript_14897/m.46859 type:complete len:223 (-) Transcript_14897:473-1141(-)
MPLERREVRQVEEGVLAGGVGERAGDVEASRLVGPGSARELAAARGVYGAQGVVEGVLEDAAEDVVPRGGGVPERCRVERDEDVVRDVERLEVGSTHLEVRQDTDKEEGGGDDQGRQRDGEVVAAPVLGGRAVRRVAHRDSEHVFGEEVLLRVDVPPGDGVADEEGQRRVAEPDVEPEGSVPGEGLREDGMFRDREQEKAQAAVGELAQAARDDLGVGLPLV